MQIKLQILLQTIPLPSDRVAVLSVNGAEMVCLNSMTFWLNISSSSNDSASLSSMDMRTFRLKLLDLSLRVSPAPDFQIIFKSNRICKWIIRCDVSIQIQFSFYILIGILMMHSMHTLHLLFALNQRVKLNVNINKTYLLTLPSGHCRFKTKTIRDPFMI